MMKFYWLHQLLNQTRQQETAFQVPAPFEWNKLPKSLRLEKDLRRNPIEVGAISGFSAQKSLPE